MKQTLCESSFSNLAMFKDPLIQLVKVHNLQIVGLYPRLDLLHYSRPLLCEDRQWHVFPFQSVLLGQR